jgi:hypothetical protein
MRSANVQPSHSITITRTVVALLAGSACGAVLTSVTYAMLVAATGQPSLGLWMGVAAFPLSFAVWGAGLLVVGVPVGLALQARGLLSRKIAAIAGAGLVLVAVMSVLLVTNSSDPGSPPGLEALWFAIPLGVIGGVVGRVAFSVAHGGRMAHDEPGA